MSRFRLPGAAALLALLASLGCQKDAPLSPLQQAMQDCFAQTGAVIRNGQWLVAAYYWVPSPGYCDYKTCTFPAGAYRTAADAITACRNA
jgi:hypothetical protein